jgi:hypothetical protein
MLVEAGSEFLPQKHFFAPRFVIEHHQQNQEAKPTSQMTLDHGSPESCEEEARVDWVANPAIRAGADQFVLVF